MNADYSRSALDRTHRVSLEADYDFKPFKGGSWAMRNLVGNWVAAPIYTYESPEYATALSGQNANLNGDSGAAIDRPLINAAGVKGTGTGVVPVVNTSLSGRCDATALSGPSMITSDVSANAAVPACGYDTVAYSAGSVNSTTGVFTPSNAYYVEAAPGTLPTVGRNTLPIRPIDNVDLSVFKRLAFHERYNLELGAQAFNVLNHAQYIPGTVDNVNISSYTNSYSFQTVSSALFNRPDKEFKNNARTMQISAKFLF